MSIPFHIGHPGAWQLDRRQFLAMLALGGAATVVPASTARAFQANASAGGKYSTTEALLQRYVAEGKLANAVAAIGRAGAAPVFLAWGPITLGGSTPADADSLYRVYSMTKPITGIAAMLLVEDGKLRLDQPLADIFPDYARMNVLTDPTKSLDTRPAKNPILIRHLLTHTSGLTYDIMGDFPLPRLYRDEGIVPHQALAEPPHPRPANLIAFAEKVATLPLLQEPGTAFSYSISLDVMGAVIERVSGQPFDLFLARRLFDPLGMKDTFFTVPPDKLGGLGPIYLGTPRGLIPLDSPPDSAYARPPVFPYGGAGLVSSPRDYDRFLAMLLGEGAIDGARVMKSETARLAMSNLLPDGVLLPADFDGGGGFGAGGRVSLADVPGGPGAGTYGWAGAAGTIAWVDRKRGVRGSGFIQKFPPGQDPFGADLVAAVYRDLA